MPATRFCLSATLVLCLLPGCAPSWEGQSAGHAITVAVSIVPQAWLVEQIGGEHVRVITMIKPGESHEAYQPTDAQVSQIMGAKVFFRIGMPFEQSPTFRSIQSSGKLTVVDVRQGMELRPMSRHSHADDTGGGGAFAGAGQHARHHEDPEETADPHVWLTPRLLAIQARTVAQTLQQLDPANHDDYHRRLEAFLERLAQADRAIRATLAPVKGKAFFVFHPAWGYFADEYGLRQVAIEVEGKDPSDRELTELQKLARQERIKVVFVQPQISSRAAEAVAQAVGASVAILDPLVPDVAENLQRVARTLADSYR